MIYRSMEESRGLSRILLIRNDRILSEFFLSLSKIHKKRVTSGPSSNFIARSFDRVVSSFFFFHLFYVSKRHNEREKRI